MALVQWLHESGKAAGKRVICVYADTGWASPEWPARVARGEALARSYGFDVARVGGRTLYQLAQKRKAWPRNGMQFCTSDLKVTPITEWLSAVDPDGESVIAIGIRRSESAARSQWPEYVSESDKHGGRDAWFPLVRVTDTERDALLRRAGFEPLPHRSRECYPCVNSNRADLRTLDAARVEEIAAMEEAMGTTSKGKPRTLFRPSSKGGAVGIREVVRWAQSAPGKFDTDQPSLPGCDGGWCE